MQWFARSRKKIGNFEEIQASFDKKPSFYHDELLKVADRKHQFFELFLPNQPLHFTICLQAKAFMPVSLTISSEIFLL
jgi:hypothetical protein